MVDRYDKLDKTANILFKFSYKLVNATVFTFMIYLFCLISRGEDLGNAILSENTINIFGQVFNIITPSGAILTLALTMLYLIAFFFIFRLNLKKLNKIILKVMWYIRK